MNYARAMVRGWRGEDAATVLAAYERSGLSLREFAQLRGVGLSTLKRYRRLERESRQARLIPVEVDPGAALVLAHPSGMRVEIGRGFDSETLRRLIEALGA